MKLKCVVVDDEPLAREGLINYVEVIDYLQLIGVAENPLELNKVLDDESIDLIFMDIQMPFMTGLEFLKIKERLPLVILTTAFPNYAVEGFQFDVIDYLLKPITFNRFFKAANKAKELWLLKNGQALQKAEIAEPEYVFIKCDNKYEKIYLNDILYVQALQNYVTIFTEKGKFMTLLPMKTVEANLDAKQFLRVHKSFLISILKVETIENNEIFIQNARIPIGRTMRDQVLEAILGKKLWSK
jgi:DNA-binding LytR/AlgR family response regulator